MYTTLVKVARVMVVGLLAATPLTAAAQDARGTITGTVVDASEFRAALIFAIAAARMAAMIQLRRLAPTASTAEPTTSESRTASTRSASGKFEPKGVTSTTSTIATRRLTGE